MAKDDTTWLRRRLRSSVPPWKGPFENWARKWVYENHWRIAHSVGSVDDAMQECALVYCRCIKYYRFTVDNHLWFMALFQTAVRNHWNTISKRDSQLREATSQYALEVQSQSEEAEEENILLAELRGSLSDELARVLDLILDAPSELIEILLRARSAKKTNRRLCRFAGLLQTGDRDILGELKQAIEAQIEEPIDRKSLSPDARADAEKASKISDHLFSNAVSIVGQQGRYRKD